MHWFLLANLRINNSVAATMTSSFGATFLEFWVKYIAIIMGEQFGGQIIAISLVVP